MHSISYIIYIHNHAQYIEALFQTLSNQEGGFRKEYVIVDDGSDDESLYEIKKHIKLLYKATILSHDHYGSAHSIAEALSIIHGNYVLFVSGNEALSYDLSEILLQGCITHDAPIAITSADTNTSVSYKLISNPLEEVICNLDKPIAQIGARASMVKRAILDELVSEHMSYFIAPMLSLMLAHDNQFVECPTTTKILSHSQEANLDIKQSVYYQLQPLVSMIEQSSETLLPVAQNLYLSVMQQIRKTRNLTLKEWCYYLLTKCTTYKPSLEHISATLNQELHKLI